MNETATTASPSASSPTWHRVLSAAAMLAFFAVWMVVQSLWWLLPALVAVFGALTLYELVALIRLRSLRVSYVVCLVFALALVADAQKYQLQHSLYILTLFVLVLLTLRVAQSDFQNLAGEVGAAFLATAYVGLPMAMATAMSATTDATGVAIGRYHMLFQIVVVFGGDSAAYFVGRHLGRRPFFPKLSPKKTLEGAIGSVLFSVFFALILTLLLGPLRQTYGLKHGLILGLLLGIAAPLGDLAESAFKREAGRKDSSNLLRGHGGFLDVFDSLLFGLPVQFCYLQLVLAPSSGV
jgi:phosphatidate cytidylyltransferase